MIDTTAPASTIQFPSDSGSYNTSGWNNGSVACTGAPATGICGTVTDAGSGVQQVDISLRDGSGNYYDGSGFNNGSETFLTATGAANWSYALAAAALVTGHTYTLHVQATDNVGNVESVQSIAFTYDTTAPSTPTFTTKPANPSTDSNPAFAFNGDIGTTFVCSLDNAAGPFTPCTANYAVSPDGSHTMYVKQKDGAGNLSASASYTWTLVTTAPSITSGPPSSTSTTSATFQFSSPDPGLSLQCDLDGAGFAACASPDTFVSLSPGAHIFSVRAVDAAGGTGPAATASWTIGPAGGGAVPPHIVSVTPADGSTVASVGPTIALTADRSVIWSNVVLQHDGDTPVSETGGLATTLTIPFSSTTIGLYTITATIDDGVDPASSVVTHFTIWVAGSGPDAPPTSETAYPSSTTGLPDAGGTLASSDGQERVTWSNRGRLHRRDHRDD